jgi:hypothetical protein
MWEAFHGRAQKHSHGHPCRAARSAPGFKLLLFVGWVVGAQEESGLD